MNKLAVLCFSGLSICVCFVLITTRLVAGEENPSLKSAYYNLPDNGGLPNKLSENLIVDSLVVHKSEHLMVVFRKRIALKRYSVHLGANPVGPKECVGDLKTPEGRYFITYKNPASKFHKSLGISYPNSTDVQRAAKLGKAPGGEIMIHGLPNGEENVGPERYMNDWTWGCVAVRNAEIDELFDHVEAGTPLLITP